MTGVVRHPAGKERGFRDGGEEDSPHLLGVLAAQHRRHVVVEVLDDGVTCVISAELVVELGEHVRRGLDRSHVTETDSYSLGAWARNAWLWRDQPTKGRFIPRGLGRL